MRGFGASFGVILLQMYRSAQFKPPYILITGPTGSGKTVVSIELCRRLESAEIISVDSRQFYRGMDIGTAKPTSHQQAQVRHHFLDIADPREVLSAGEFARRARTLIEEMHFRGIMPVLVGGSGMFWKAIIDGFYEDETSYDAIRVELQQRLKSEGIESLYNDLKTLDPVAHHRLDGGDTQRILRALEVRIAGGQAIHEKWGAIDGESGLEKPLMIWVDREREALYGSIDQRVDTMVNEGLFQEVASLMELGLGEKTFVMDSMGYIEPMRHLRGEMSRESAVEAIKRNTRRFAKRQQTWFRRDRRLRRLDLGCWGIDGVCQRILCQLQQV